MDNKIDALLEQIGSEVPKVNPYLSNKIYSKAIQSDSKKNIPFFKKPFIIAFSSLLVFVIFVFGSIRISGFILENGNNFLSSNKTDFGDNSNISNDDSNGFDFDLFIPNLSPTIQDTVFIDYYYTVYTIDYDTVTIIINNKINYQKIYLKAYNLDIKDVKLNNGDVEISQVTIDDELFFEIVFDNTNTNIHYLDICFKKGSIENILNHQESLKFGFIMYIDEVDAKKGYGYDFQIREIINLREGNNV